MAGNAVDPGTLWYVEEVRKALEKIHAKGDIGTVDIWRCVSHLREAERRIRIADDGSEDLRKALKRFLDDD